MASVWCMQGAQGTWRQRWQVISTSCFALSNGWQLLSLRVLMGNRFDFTTEETALQFLGSQHGLQVMLTPKFHCEICRWRDWVHLGTGKGTNEESTNVGEKERSQFYQPVTRCLCPASYSLDKRKGNKVCGKSTSLYMHILLACWMRGYWWKSVWICLSWKAAAPLQEDWTTHEKV